MYKLIGLFIVNKKKLYFIFPFRDSGIQSQISGQHRKVDIL